MADKKQKLIVAALENGTVIDHIPCDRVFVVASLLDLQHSDSKVTIGNNLASVKCGSKGLIKVSDRFFSDEEISRLAVVAPNIQLNVIRDYEVVEKKRAVLPDDLRGIVRCANPKCITNNEPMQSLFHVVDRVSRVYRCHYCEREQEVDGLRLE